MSTDAPFEISFPTSIDNSILTSFGACNQKAFLEYFCHYTHERKSIHLHAGGCFAKGLEVARLAFHHEGKGFQDSVMAGVEAVMAEWGEYEPYDPEDNKRLERVILAIPEYFREYPFLTDHLQPHRDSSGKPMVEFSFALPTELSHPDTGEPILFTGRFDQVVIYNGAVYGEDDKTTGQLGASWLKQWKLRSQFTGYTWGLRQSGEDCNGVVVRGMSFLKRSFGHAEVIETRTNWQIEEWYEWMHKRLERMIQVYKEGYWEKDLDAACSAYGGCGFQALCTSKYPHSHASTEYVRRRWDPVLGERVEVS